MYLIGRQGTLPDDVTLCFSESSGSTLLLLDPKITTDICLLFRGLENRKHFS